MKQFNFPRSRIILPAHRSTLTTKPMQNLHLPEPDEQILQTFQLLLEESLLQGTPLRLTTSAHSGKAITTGIVVGINTATARVTLQTLEGHRTLDANLIRDIQLI